MKTPLIALLVTAIILLALWDGVWKLIALWKSACHDQFAAHATGFFCKSRHLQKNRHGALFICLAVFNTAGVLPVLYILFFQKTDKSVPTPRP